MSKQTAKAIREDIARSRAYAKKNDYLRTLECLANAINGLVASQIFGAEKFEIHAHLDEAIRDLNKMKMIKKLFPQGLAFQKGKEKAFCEKLRRLHRKLKEAMDNARLAKMRKRLAVLDDNMIKAANLIKADQPIEARKLYRKISEYFQDIEGIDSDIGNRLATFGMFPEAMEYLSSSLAKSPKDARAHNALILCYEGMNEVEKGVEAIKNAMRHIGTSEGLYLRLARLYLAQRNWGAVFNNAKAALDLNPLNGEAQKLMKQAQPKVFSTPSDKGTTTEGAKSTGTEKSSKKVHDRNV